MPAKPINLKATPLSQRPVFAPETERIQSEGLTPPPTAFVPAAEMKASIADGLSGSSIQQFGKGGLEIVGELGRGGMGIVYRARQTALNRDVAIKMLKDGFDDPGELARFRAEAQIIAQMQHPNIVQIYDVGEMNGKPYFVLEYAAGGNMAARLQNKSLPPATAAAIVAALAHAVHHAHTKGIVHRDLKLENILLAEDGRPKLTDFGLARWAGNDPNVTIGKAVAGSPAYMSPEQAEGRSADIGPHTDVYGLGVVLYRMLAGHTPFRGDSLFAIIKQICMDPPPPIPNAVPPELEAICRKCLEKDPKQRYPSAAALLADLRLAMTGSGQSIRVPNATQRTIPAADEPVPQPKRRSRRVLYLAAPVALLTAGAVGWVAFGGLTPQAEATPPAPTKPDVRPAPAIEELPVPEEKAIPAREASRHVGKSITLELTVASTGQNSTATMTFLNSEDPYTDPKNVAVVIRAKDLPEFEKAGIPDPRKHFADRKIRVTGKLDEYKKTGSYQLFVSSPEQIRIVK